MSAQVVGQTNSGEVSKTAGNRNAETSAKTREKVVVDGSRPPAAVTEPDGQVTSSPKTATTFRTGSSSPPASRSNPGTSEYPPPQPQQLVARSSAALRPVVLSSIHPIRTRSQRNPPHTQLNDTHPTAMPPIPIHKNDPIKPASSPTTAAKPDGVTPQTATSTPPPNPPPPTRTVPASFPATTTSSVNNGAPPPPPPPQPGARPTPTSTSNNSAQDNASSSSSSGPPPPPQPGATPSASANPYTATHITTTTTTTTSAPARHGPPPPPPLATDSQLRAGRSTIPSTTPGHGPGPTRLNMGAAAAGQGQQPQEQQQENNAGGVGNGDLGRSILEGPPGYTQAQALNNMSYTTGAGDSGGTRQGVTDAGVGETAWNLLSQAGEALKKGEEAAWKAVRNK